MFKYLEPGDARSFDDLVQKSPRNDLGFTIECPKCKGYGKWNLRPDAYGKGKHFRASCDHCNGWGWVDSKNADHIHEWVFESNIGHCNNRYRCIVCSQTRDIDSSD